ncbi:3-oxoadipate enol-lactonase [Rugosimonospora africana]|uniref:3-oxoadipate enol-lactonase n=1 Tax=Rugosimonospora africana TaxID=556532 RepID=A0A8J3QYB9_9ACTN|nr:3-oxoadipate enol-lactonase [Rugosimonospora africana]GIH19128.1 3-oxoadipate enol-lactonase [Rugosimonospora africana]
MRVELRHELTGRPGAPVLVLGNSLGTTRELWQPQLAAFEEHFLVLRYEHRGHDGSPAPSGPYTVDDLGGDVLSLLDRLGLAQVCYAGVSIGGMVGMWLAAHAPDRIDRLALCCTTARFDSPDPYLERADQVRREGIGALAEQVVSRWFTPSFLSRESATVKRFQQTVSACSNEGYAGCCEALAAMDLLPALPSITASTLVIAGEDDPATPPRYGQAIADAIPGATLQLVPDAAHLANVEQADRVTALLVEHLVGKGDPGNVL